MGWSLQSVAPRSRGLVAGVRSRWRSRCVGDPGLPVGTAAIRAIRPSIGSNSGATWDGPSAPGSVRVCAAIMPLAASTARWRFCHFRRDLAPVSSPAIGLPSGVIRRGYRQIHQRDDRFYPAFDLLVAIRRPRQGNGWASFHPLWSFGVHQCRPIVGGRSHVGRSGLYWYNPCELC